MLENTKDRKSRGEKIGKYLLIHKQQPIMNTHKIFLSLEEPNDKQQYFAKEWDNVMFSSNAPIKSYVSNDVYKEMNLENEEVPNTLKVHEELSKME